MAHLHAILATESPLAVLIKRGPGRCSGVLRWDRRSDTFEHGQWLKQIFDFDAPRKRLVWTADCKLFAAPWTRHGLGESRLLLDTNGLGFERKQAPY